MTDSDRPAPGENRLARATARHVQSLCAQAPHCHTPAHPDEGCQ